MTDAPEILREYRVRILPAGEVEPVGLEDLGRRTKFGGAPDEIQPRGPLGISCPRCHKAMAFVAQIDSFEHNSENNPNRKDYRDQQYMFGDVGMIYVWFCFDCLVPHATMDCY